MYTNIISTIEQEVVKHRQLILKYSKNFTPMLFEASQAERCILLKLLLDLPLRDIQYMSQHIAMGYTLEESWNQLQRNK